MKTNNLFQPFKLKSLDLRNRFVMAPMTRSFSPDGVPTDNVANYYAKRAAGEVGLILSEGTVIDRPSASNDKDIPHFYGEESLKSWKKVIGGVHANGGSMAPQIWHMGVMPNHHSGWLPSAPFEGPSEFHNPDVRNGRAMTEEDIADAIAAYGRAAGEGTGQHRKHDCRIENAGAQLEAFDLLAMDGALG
ncbi:MAG: 12-oxophytodienoate reductase, partial [Mucilaginibacter polytrichastri]|nr:12-oxophytodienoate reductase [Mucilaginibacter polytrichastri]